jgi:hypothetical protein
MKVLHTVLLEFNPKLNPLAKDKALRDGLSAVVQIGATLWVVNDEALSVERLSFLEEAGGEYRFGDHVQFPLSEYLALPEPPKPGEQKIEEADIEALNYGGGYLWLAGSHSLKRSRPKQDRSDMENFERLAKIGRDGNRHLLARIPVVEQDGVPTLAETAEGHGAERTAARLRGDGKGNDLTQALKKDVHLAPFLEIPGKDNGLDIEGLAVSGERVFLGLRGPVLRGWAVILELEPVEDNKPGKLKLQKIGSESGDAPYRKHFLALDGLGVRDLCVDGADLLILAGPTLDLDGPVRLFRWKGGARPKAASLVAGSALERVMALPYGCGVDHAEGLTRFHPPGGEDSAGLLVVYDVAAPERYRGASAVTADIFYPER